MSAGMTLSDVWREPMRGTFANPAVVALPGIEQLRTFLDGRSPRAPIARLVGRRLVGVGEGTATYTMPVTDWILGPTGRVHAGMLVLLADAPLLSAALTTLPPYTLCTTAELSMTFLGEPPTAGSLLRARGRLIHADSRTALCEAFVEDDTGRLCAHGTSRCTIKGPLRASAGDDDAYDPEPAAEEAEDTPDPPLRPACGEVIPAEVVGRLTGLELLAAQVAGDLPLPPIHHLIGIRPVAADRGRAVFALPAHDWLCNEFGTIFGGATGLCAKSAVAGAVQTLAPAGTSYRALDVKVNYLRPVTPDGRDLVATGTVVHNGRRLAIATAEVVNGDGDRVAIATGTTMLGSSRGEGGG